MGEPSGSTSSGCPRCRAPSGTRSIVVPAEYILAHSLRRRLDGPSRQLIETRATERATAALRVPATLASAAVVTHGDAVDDDAADVEAGRALIDSVPKPEVVLDGPVGAPAQGYSRYKVLMLVGAVGLTSVRSSATSSIRWRRSAATTAAR